MKSFGNKRTGKLTKVIISVSIVNFLIIPVLCLGFLLLISNDGGSYLYYLSYFSIYSIIPNIIVCIILSSLDNTFSKKTFLKRFLLNNLIITIIYLFILFVFFGINKGDLNSYIILYFDLILTTTIRSLVCWFCAWQTTD
ncbi:MAG: hypothetical protein EAZ53_01230 [Bacteroidetes bacterium]|nr:MAG: hypothetical protein EAZ53_01230 [Bacteroidota bacterium]